MINRHPHELRVLAREMQYGNTQDERRTIRDVDKAVFEKVRIYERQQVERADWLRKEARDLRAALVDVLATLDSEVGQRLAEGADPDVALAKRYSQLQDQSDKIQKDLGRAVSEMAFTEARAADPYASYMAMMDKWPLVRPLL